MHLDFVAAYEKTRIYFSKKFSTIHKKVKIYFVNLLNINTFDMLQKGNMLKYLIWFGKL